MNGIESWKRNISAGISQLMTGVVDGGKCSSSLCAKEALINMGRKTNAMAECLWGEAKRQTVNLMWHLIPRQINNLCGL